MGMGGRHLFVLHSRDIQKVGVNSGDTVNLTLKLYSGYRKLK
jgi:hypothetical protein